MSVAHFRDAIERIIAAFKEMVDFNEQNDVQSIEFKKSGADER